MWKKSVLSLAAIIALGACSSAEDDAADRLFYGAYLTDVAQAAWTEAPKRHQIATANLFAHRLIGSPELSESGAVDRVEALGLDLRSCMNGLQRASGVTTAQMAAACSVEIMTP